MRKNLFTLLTLAMILIGANAWADFALDFTTDGQNLLPGGYKSAPDILVTNQYSSYGVAFLPEVHTGGASGSVTVGGAQYQLGGATYGYWTKSTGVEWYGDSSTLGIGCMNHIHVAAQGDLYGQFF